MIINFFFDNRIGGPHINIFKISKILKKKIIHVTIGKSNYSEINLINLRNISKFFYPFEIIINILQIIIHFRKYNCIFLSNSIYNIAPIISGAILGKKTYWYLLEEPNFFSKIIFFSINKLFKFEILTISKNICKELKIKNYKYFPPYICQKKIKIKKLNNRQLKIFSVGNINKVKNHFFAIKNLSKLKLNYKYKIIGSKINTQAHLYNYLKNYLVNNKLKKKVKFLGYKKQIEILKIINKFDIFLLPSITEGTPISLLEAMSLGKICVCSKVGDIPLIIKNNQNGFLINLNEKSFLKTIYKIKRMREKEIKKIQINAIKTINKNFSDKEIYSKILK